MSSSLLSVLNLAHGFFIFWEYWFSPKIRILNHGSTTPLASIIFMTGQLEAYLRVSSKLKLDIVGDDFSFKLNTPRQTNSDTDATGTTKSGEI